jgi:2-polyprenyl-3-methyl-5-hydroxy-6-metoxy-1,4-benzoquinol methylase
VKQGRYNSKYISGELRPDEGAPFERVQSDVGKCLFAAQFSENKIVLDVACGSGHISSFLKRNARVVIGGDASKSAIRYASSHYRKDGLHFLLLDAQQLPFADNTFNLIVSMETIEHLPQYERFLIECHRVLKADGVFVCSTTNKAVASPNTKRTSSSSHAKEFYPQEFCELSKKYFQEVTLHGQIPKSRIERVYLRLRTLTLPVFNLCPQIQRAITLFWSLHSPSHRPLKLEKVDEDDFDKVFDEKYRPSPAQDNRLLTLTMIAVGRRKI